MFNTMELFFSGLQGNVGKCTKAYIRELTQPVLRSMQDISLINNLVQKGYGLDVHGKEYRGAISKSNLSQKLTSIPMKKARGTKRKYEKNCDKVDYGTPVAMLNISDDKEKMNMKTMTKTMTTKTTETDKTTTRKGTAVVMRKK